MVHKQSFIGEILKSFWEKDPAPKEAFGQQLIFVHSRGKLLYVQEVVTQPKILDRTILSNIIHVT